MKEKIAKVTEKQQKRPMINDGKFYFQQKETLLSFITSVMSKYPKMEGGFKPKAIIVPNGSYFFAADIYGASYSLIQQEQYDTVVVLAPVHKVSFYALGLTESSYFDTPFGEIPIDVAGNEFLRSSCKDFIYAQKYHQMEYSIELQLPFLNHVLVKPFQLLPILIGEPNTRFTILLAKTLAELLKSSDKKYLIVAVTNLSNDADLDTTLATDRKLIELLKEKNPDRLAEQLAMRQVKADGTGSIVSLLRLNELLFCSEIEIVNYLTSFEVTKEPTKVEGFLSAAIY